MRARVPPPHPLIRFGIMTFERRGPSPLMSFNLKSALELGAQRLMRAYVLKHYGDPEGSQLMDVPAPMPRPGDVLVAVRAAGLNPVDFKFRQGKLRAILRPKLPFVLGNELAGEVSAAAAMSNDSAWVTGSLPGSQRIVPAHSQNKRALTSITWLTCPRIWILRARRPCRWPG